MKKAFLVSIITTIFLGITGFVGNSAHATLMAHYSFDGNANDLSGNNNHGTVFGATLTADRFGNLNNAYYFDGINDYIDGGNDPSINLTGEITMSVWINPYSIDTGRIISKWGLDSGYELDIANGGVRFNINQYGETPIPIAPYEWTFLTATWDGSTKNLYFDGDLVHSASTPTFSNLEISPNNLLIGEMANFAPNPWYHGVIDDVRIYDTVLSVNEIGQLYAPAPVPEPATMLLLGTGLVGLAGIGRKKFLKK